MITRQLKVEPHGGAGDMAAKTQQQQNGRDEARGQQFQWRIIKKQRLKIRRNKVGENKGGVEERGRRAGEDEKPKNSPGLDVRGPSEHGLLLLLLLFSSWPGSLRKIKLASLPSARRDPINSVRAAHYCSKALTRREPRSQGRGISSSAFRATARRDVCGTGCIDAGDQTKARAKTENLPGGCRTEPISDLSCQYINKAFF